MHVGHIGHVGGVVRIGHVGHAHVWCRAHRTLPEPPELADMQILWIGLVSQIRNIWKVLHFGVSPASEVSV